MLAASSAKPPATLAVITAGRAFPRSISTLPSQLARPMTIPWGSSTRPVTVVPWCWICCRNTGARNSTANRTTLAMQASARVKARAGEPSRLRLTGAGARRPMAGLRSRTT